jgi:dienelactone hydrolase
MPAPEPTPALWAGLVPGPYGAGYRRLETPNGVVHVWYPTREGDGRRLLFRDYLGEDARSTAAFLSKAGLDSSAVDSLFGTSLFAVTSPSPLEETRPLVLIAQGNGEDAADQVVLCEYLAGEGFVVAATPSPMRETPLEREDQVGMMAEVQASDLAAAVGAVAEAVPVDTLRLGVVGHSFGARAALLLAMRDGRVRALVSLDGGIGTATAVEHFRRAPSFRADAKFPPVLHFYEELDAFMKPDFTLLRSLDTRDLILKPTSDMHHVHFTTYGFAAATFPGLRTLTHATEATAPAAVAVARATAAFLHAHLD